MMEHPSDDEEQVLTLTFKCPIFVDVNLTTGEIDRVSIGDQVMDYGESTVTGYFAFTAEQAARAKQIAEDADWPDWTFD
jgi:hypothetical protein